VDRQTRPKYAAAAHAPAPTPTSEQLLLCHLLGCVLCLLDGFPPPELLARDSPLLDDRRDDLRELYVLSIYAAMQVLLPLIQSSQSIRPTDGPHPDGRTD